jgi:hypothetical protein
MNPRLIGIAVGAWLGLAWAIGVGEMIVVLALALAGYVVAVLATKRTSGEEGGEVMSWRWPRRREARTAARRQRQARRTATPDEAPLRVEVVSGNGSSRSDGVGRAVS